MFYQISFSTQVKRFVVISDKHGQYELPDKLPNDLRLRILGKQEILGNGLTLQNESAVGSLFPHMNILLILEENSWKIEIKLFPLCAISHQNYSYFLQKYVFGSKSPQIPLKLISLKFLVILRSFRKFCHKITAVKWQKSPRICYFGLLTQFVIQHQETFKLILRQFLER